MIAFVLLNKKDVPDFTGSTDKPLDFVKGSFRIFIKDVSRKCSYQNISIEKYGKVSKGQRQIFTYLLYMVNNTYICLIYLFKPHKCVCKLYKQVK